MGLSKDDSDALWQAVQDRKYYLFLCSPQMSIKLTKMPKHRRPCQIQHGSQQATQSAWYTSPQHTNQDLPSHDSTNIKFY